MNHLRVFALAAFAAALFFAFIPQTAHATNSDQTSDMVADVCYAEPEEPAID